MPSTPSRQPTPRVGIHSASSTSWNGPAAPVSKRIQVATSNAERDGGGDQRRASG